MKYLTIILIITMLLSSAFAEPFAGRLYIDDADINVALYYSHKQEVVDNDDSAAYFFFGTYHGVIADHNTEAFSTLGRVKVGTLSRIEGSDGTDTYYQCIDVFEGINIRTDITDLQGNSVTNRADLLMYTCVKGSKNILITLWSKITVINGIETEKALDTVIEETWNLIDKMLVQHNKMLE